MIPTFKSHRISFLLLNPKLHQVLRNGYQFVMVSLPPIDANWLQSFINKDMQLPNSLLGSGFILKRFSVLHDDVNQKNQHHKLLSNHKVQHTIKLLFHLHLRLKRKGWNTCPEHCRAQGRNTVVPARNCNRLQDSLHCSFDDEVDKD
jgi:hypothetical protein